MVPGSPHDVTQRGDRWMRAFLCGTDSRMGVHLGRGSEGGRRSDAVCWREPDKLRTCLASFVPQGVSLGCHPQAKLGGAAGGWSCLGQTIPISGSRPSSGTPKPAPLGANDALRVAPGGTHLPARRAEHVSPPRKRWVRSDIRKGDGGAAALSPRPLCRPVGAQPQKRHRLRGTGGVCASLRADGPGQMLWAPFGAQRQTADGPNAAGGTRLGVIPGTEYLSQARYLPWVPQAACGLCGMGTGVPGGPPRARTGCKQPVAPIPSNACAAELHTISPPPGRFRFFFRACCFGFVSDFEFRISP